MQSDRSISRVKNDLVRLIDDRDHRVIALSGPWGTGKTYLWRQIDRERRSVQSKERHSVTASLFGVRSIGELKLRLLKQVWAADKSGVQKGMNTVSGMIRGAAMRFTGVAVEDLMLTWLPDMLSGRLIAIDDVERKHAALGVDEILGFIDEYSETHGVRFLLLLNREELGDGSELWTRLREKVIDAELVLDTTTEEALSIACGDRHQNAAYLPSVERVLRILSITNIRVVRRVLNVVAKIHAASAGATDVPFERWLPSTVLMTAAHFRAVPDPPTFAHLRDLGSWEHYYRDVDAHRSEQLKRWDKLLAELQIASADEFEDILEAYLKTGMLDEAALRLLFNKYRTFQFDQGAEQRRCKFMEDFYWAPEVEEEALLTAAHALMPDAQRMLPSHISDVANLIEELGDSGLANAMLTAWASGAESRPEYQNLRSRYSTSSRALRPEVERKLQEIYDLQKPPLSLLEAVEYLAANNSWGSQHEIPLTNSTPKEYLAVLQSLTGQRLASVVNEHLEWMTLSSPSDPKRTAVLNFVAAARQICSEQAKSRMASILRRSFESRGMSEKLS